MSQSILFVDDEIPIRETLSLCFKRKGLDVTTAGTGKEAITLAEKNPFDLVILDVNLGEESGLDLLDFFKRTYPKLPVIMFTGAAHDPVVRSKAMDKGASAVLSKTEPLDNLIKEVQQAMANS